MTNQSANSIKLGFSLVFLCLLVMGCKKSSNGGSSSGGGVTSNDQNWSGTTSQSQAVSFITDGVKILSFTIDVQYIGVFCSGTMTATFTSPQPTITTNAFSYLKDGSSYSGNFSSTNSVSGNFSVYNTTCTGNGTGTWTATRA